MNVGPPYTEYTVVIQTSTVLFISVTPISIDCGRDDDDSFTGVDDDDDDDHNDRETSHNKKKPTNMKHTSNKTYNISLSLSLYIYIYIYLSLSIYLSIYLPTYLSINKTWDLTLSSCAASCAQEPICKMLREMVNVNGSQRKTNNWQNNIHTITYTHNSTTIGDARKRPLPRRPWCL